MSRQSISNVNCSVLSKSEINGKRNTRCVLQPTGVVSDTITPTVYPVRRTWKPNTARQKRSSTSWSQTWRVSNTQRKLESSVLILRLSVSYIEGYLLLLGECCIVPYTIRKERLPKTRCACPTWTRPFNSNTTLSFSCSLSLQHSTHPTMPTIVLDRR
jgi:hypothetical protein